MKRKNGKMEPENAEPFEKQAEKRRRVNGAGDSKPSYRTCSNKGVTIEEMVGMGVDIIEDASNESFDQPPPKPVTINLVLKPKDPNIRKTTQSCSELCEGVKYPNTGSGFSARIGHSGSGFPYDRMSSVLGDCSMPDKFHKYTKSTRRSMVCGEDSFNKMSDEVVLHVLRWLPKCSLARCALVCKRWNRLSKDDSLWKRVDLGLKTIHPGVIGQVLSRGTHVLRLARANISAPIFQSPFLPEPSLRPGELCKLQYLDLSMATIKSTCLAELIDKCKNLRKLALEKCDISESVCCNIGNNPKLEVLHLAMCEGFTEDGVGSIMAGCKNLTELNISWTDLSSPGLDILCSTAPRGLERICLAGYRETLQDAHVESLVVRCRNLREFDISDATKITSKSLISIIENLVRIESLSTTRCYNITPSQYLLLINCPALLYLNVYGLLKETALTELKERLSGIEINKHPLTSIARPTIGIKRTSIWNLRVRD